MSVGDLSFRYIPAVIFECLIMNTYHMEIENLRKVWKESGKKGEGRREIERKEEMEGKVSTSGHMSRSAHGQLILLALPLSPKTLVSKKWWSLQLPRILSETQVFGRRFYCHHWTPFPGCFGKSLQCWLRKSTVDWDTLIPWDFFMAFSLPSPGHNFWGL